MSATEDLELAYPSVILEITRRLVACENALANLSADPAQNDGWIASDLVTLQVRKICEMLLLGSSLAHLFGGHTGFDPRKWNPKDAFCELEKINKHPLPAPIELSFFTMPTGDRQIRPVSKPLPFKLLSTLYGHCGNLLHVASAEKVLKSRIPPFDISLFANWVHGLKRLVAGHVLLLPDLEKILLCTWSGVDGENPQIYLMEARGPSNFDIANLPDFNLFAA